MSEPIDLSPADVRLLPDASESDRHRLMVFLSGGIPLGGDYITDGRLFDHMLRLVWIKAQMRGDRISYEEAAEIEVTHPGSRRWVLVARACASGPRELG